VFHDLVDVRVRGRSLVEKDFGSNGSRCRPSRVRGPHRNELSGLREQNEASSLRYGFIGGELDEVTADAEMPNSVRSLVMAEKSRRRVGRSA
jgi:hypothetical protein